MRSYISVWIKTIACSSRKNSRRVDHDLRERKDSEKESNDRENEEKPRVFGKSIMRATRAARNEKSSRVNEQLFGWRTRGRLPVRAGRYARNKRTHSQSSRCERRELSVVPESGSEHLRVSRDEGREQTLERNALEAPGRPWTLEEELHGASGVDRFRLIRYRYRGKWRLRFCAIFGVKSSGSPYPRDNWMREPFMRRLINFMPREVVVDEGTVAEHVHVSFE